VVIDYDYLMVVVVVVRWEAGIFDDLFFSISKREEEM